MADATVAVFHVENAALSPQCGHKTGIGFSRDEQRCLSAGRDQNLKNT
jgi:hypothetical protein